MSRLSLQKCQSCLADTPKIDELEVASLIRDIPQWAVEVRNNVMQLERIFTFKNFKQALAFTNKIADMAEQQGHHPALLTEWGKVTVTWWSHNIEGLHKNDFICAAKTDNLLL